MVRAKFICQSKTERNDGGDPPTGFEVKLTGVTGGSEENETFFKYTPAATIDLQTINSRAAEQFQVGKTYYVDFQEAPEDS